MSDAPKLPETSTPQTWLMAAGAIAPDLSREMFGFLPNARGDPALARGLFDQVAWGSAPDPAAVEKYRPRETNRQLLSYQALVMALAAIAPPNDVSQAWQGAQANIAYSRQALDVAAKAMTSDFEVPQMPFFDMYTYALTLGFLRDVFPGLEQIHPHLETITSRAFLNRIADPEEHPLHAFIRQRFEELKKNPGRVRAAVRERNWDKLLSVLAPVVNVRASHSEYEAFADLIDGSIDPSGEYDKLKEKAASLVGQIEDKEDEIGGRSRRKSSDLHRDLSYLKRDRVETLRRITAIEKHVSSKVLNRRAVPKEALRQAWMAQQKILKLPGYDKKAEFSSAADAVQTAADIWRRIDNMYPEWRVKCREIANAMRKKIAGIPIIVTNGPRPSEEGDLDTHRLAFAVTQRMRDPNYPEPASRPTKRKAKGGPNMAIKILVMAVKYEKTHPEIEKRRAATIIALDEICRSLVRVPGVDIEIVASVQTGALAMKRERLFVCKPFGEQYKGRQHEALTVIVGDSEDIRANGQIIAGGHAVANDFTLIQKPQRLFIIIGTDNYQFTEGLPLEWYSIHQKPTNKLGEANVPAFNVYFDMNHMGDYARNATPETIGEVLCDLIVSASQQIIVQPDVKRGRRARLTPG